MNNSGQVLTSLSNILEHIQEVQENVVKLSHESMLILARKISEYDIELGSEELAALQHQDILSQQLGAASESIRFINQYIKKYTYTINEDSNLMADGFVGLDAKLQQALIEAKDRKNALSGHAFENKEEEIEFF